MSKCKAINETMNTKNGDIKKQDLIYNWLWIWTKLVVHIMDTNIANIIMEVDIIMIHRL